MTPKEIKISRTHEYKLFEITEVAQLPDPPKKDYYVAWKNIFMDGSRFRLTMEEIKLLHGLLGEVIKEEGGEQ